MRWIIMCFGLFLLSCGKSPILNEEVAKVESPHSLELGNRCSVIFSEREFCAEVKWIKVPTVLEAGAAEVIFHKKDSSGKWNELLWTDNKACTFSLFMDMGGHGHGGDGEPVSTLNFMKNGFLLSQIAPTMKGKWQLKMEMKVAEPSMRVLRAQYEFDVKLR